MKIMLSLGSGRKKTWRYLVGCTGITAFTGCLFGGGLGAWLSEELARQAYAEAVARHSQDLRYSIQTIGEQRTLSEQIHIAGYIPAVSAALILAAALVIGGVLAALFSYADRKHPAAGLKIKKRNRPPLR